MTAAGHPPDGPSDGSLVRAIGAGDRPAADLLYRRYAGRLRSLAGTALSRGLAGRLDVDDIVQSVFRRFLRAARDGRYTLPSGGELWGLLIAITLNRVRSAEQFHRAAKRDVRQTVGLADADPAAANDPGLAAAVDELLGRLPEHHREAARLRLDGYEVAEIAAATGRSKRTVERILQETKARLRALLPTEDGPCSPTPPPT